MHNHKESKGEKKKNGEICIKIRFKNSLLRLSLLSLETNENFMNVLGVNKRDSYLKVKLENYASFFSGVF